MRWVKASERLPTIQDADRYHHVLIRRKPSLRGVTVESGEWVFTTRPFSEVDPQSYIEWLEGAKEPVEGSSTGSKGESQ